MMNTKRGKSIDSDKGSKREFSGSKKSSPEKVTMGYDWFEMYVQEKEKNERLLQRLELCKSLLYEVNI
jgi:hypothetical protein